MTLSWSTVERVHQHCFSIRTAENLSISEANIVQEPWWSVFDSRSLLQSLSNYSTMCMVWKNKFKKFEESSINWLPNFSYILIPLNPLKRSNSWPNNNFLHLNIHKHYKKIYIYKTDYSTSFNFKIVQIFFHLIWFVLFYNIRHGA